MRNVLYIIRRSIIFRKLPAARLLVVAIAVLTIVPALQALGSGDLWYQSTQITANAFGDYSPQISVDKVVWRGRGGPGGSYEIYLYNGSSVTTLTANAFGDYDSQVSGDKVVWYGRGGQG